MCSRSVSRRSLLASNIDIGFPLRRGEVASPVFRLQGFLTISKGYSDVIDLIPTSSGYFECIGEVVVNLGRLGRHDRNNPVAKAAFPAYHDVD